MEYFLDGKEMKDLTAAHEHISRTLGFPAHYGKNLDALYDCVCDLDDALIVIRNTDAMFENLGQKANDIIGVLDDAANEGFIELEIE